MQLNDRWWNKTRRLSLTKDLVAWLEAAELTPQIKEFCAFVHNKIIIQNEDPRLFTNIHSDYWKRRMGTRHYKQVLELLKKNGFLEVNPPYSNLPGKEFTKSYRIPQISLNTGIQTLSFKVKYANLPRDESQITAPVLVFFLDCLRQLTLRDGEWPETGDTFRDAKILDSAQRILHGVWNVHFSEEGKRCYHAVIMAPRELRPLLCFKAAPDSPIFESDIKSCHPVLLLSLATDEGERQRYKQVLSRDIYKEIAAFGGNRRSRDEIKDDSWFFINGGRTNNITAAFFLNNFPVLAQIILKHPNISVYLQQLESEIVCRTVGVFAMEKKIWFVPQHDGFLSKSEADAAVLGASIQDNVQRVSGYRPEIKTVHLNP